MIYIYIEREIIDIDAYHPQSPHFETRPLLIPFGESALLLAADQVTHHADGLGHMDPTAGLTVNSGYWFIVGHNGS